MTKTVDFSGKWWLLPDGKCIECTLDEHARIARGVMLGVSADNLHCAFHLDEIFKPLTPAQAEMWRNRGADSEAINFLCSDDESVDPRLFMIRKGWIRQRGCDFYAWTWGEAALQKLSNADEFWKSQKNVTPRSWAVLWNVADSNYMAGTLESLLPRFAEKKP